jgi:cell division protein FtsB
MKKAKFLKMALVALLILSPIITWLAFGKRGFVQLYRMDLERQAYVDRIRQLAEENQTLMDEIERLRTDPEYVESVARRELGLIKENEIIYRFDKAKSRPGETVVSKQRTREGTATEKSRRKEGRDGRVE